ncbi:MAG: complex I NDUFA9 subunit family protein [Burkholderiaceae bacterium]|nr:complex I NDUFA9 subunit family protein [Burkholderiaceae bacterium]
MRYPNVLVIGGSGFIGSHVAARLGATGHQVLVPTRRLARARHLLPLPTVRTVEADVMAPGALAPLLAGVDAVVNLVGVLHGARGPAGSSYGAAFERAHVALPAHVLAECRRAGVRRYVHLSAQGADPDAAQPLASMYLRSKSDGERVVRDATDIDWTILRPSAVYGAEDRFLNLFARMLRYLPILPLLRADAKLQPIHVSDVATALVNALENPACVGHSFALCGPEVLSLGELARLVGRISGHERPVYEVPDDLGRIQAMLMEWIPGQTMMSRDSFDTLGVDAVCADPVSPELGVTPAPLAVVVPTYLGSAPPRFALERSRARR